MRKLIFIGLFIISVSACGDKDKSGEPADKETAACTCGGEAVSRVICRKDQTCHCNNGVASCS